MSNDFIRNGFIISGLVNILAVLFLSRAFTNAAIPETDPVVMSNFGLLMIAVWGLVFLAVASRYQYVKWVVGAFVVEKLVYAVVWFRWITTHNVAAVYAKDAFAGIFYSVYGLNDFLFFLFFAAVFYQLHRLEANQQKEALS
ncbi:hypothetical protein [Hymenobacter glacialis]|uniref:Uncharacterized protein n=1 Tax=Hymenobacter glacialis TaxID=1908236 RepID=A0A1G1TD93_9BACT|nr:hypothetical protein [Hymenobacter glacialis]OGX88830.1 hypothetical protein BEN48_07680 [Hymenobacter glacialis]